MPEDAVLIDTESEDEKEEYSPTLLEYVQEPPKPRMTAVKTPSPAQPKPKASQANLENQLVEMNAKYEELLCKFQAMNMNKCPVSPKEEKPTFTPEHAAPSGQRMAKAAPAAPKPAPQGKPSDESEMIHKYDLEDKDRIPMAHAGLFCLVARSSLLMHCT